MLTGIDVSHHNGPIDWRKVAAAGHTFAIIKATEGSTWTDPTYSRNRADATAAGLIVGAYHFLRAESDPAEQAQHFLQAIGQREGQLLALDVERAAPPNPSAEQVGVFLAEIRRQTRHPIGVYTSPGFWAMLGNPPAPAGAYLWLARWAVQPGTPPGTWSHWTLWQHTNDGHVSGINGTVDLDYFYAGAAALAQLTKETPMTPPTTLQLTTDDVETVAQRVVTLLGKDLTHTWSTASIRAAIDQLPTVLADTLGAAVLAVLAPGLAATIVDMIALRLAGALPPHLAVSLVSTTTKRLVADDVARESLTTPPVEAGG
jgi:GH25 family lysozyme M1 (1,4-beta-N-acetylmuramidase)